MATDISCVMPRPDIGDLHDRFTTELSARLLGGAPVLPMSAEDILSFVMAGAANLMHAYVNQALVESDPATMCCDNLIQYAVRHGFNLRGSTRAKGYVLATGTPGATIPATSRFIGANGTEYKLDPSITTNPAMLDSFGKASLRVVSVGASVAYNIPGGTVLTVGSTTPGINPTVTVAEGGVAGGTEAETCDQLRVRIVAAEARGVATVNANWFLNEAEKYPGVTKVCLDHCNACCDPSEVSLYPFFGDVYPPYGVPPGSVIDEMNDWMFGARPGMGEGLAPFGIVGDFKCALPTKMDVTLNCFKGCDTNIVEEVRTGLQTFINARYCVGDTICKNHLVAAINAAAGPDSCFASADLQFDGTQWAEDAANIYLDCGHFLVVDDIVVAPVEPLHRPTISSITPTGGIVGADPFTLHVYGTNYTSSSVIWFNNVAVPTSFVSPTELVATIDPEQATGIATVPVQVRNGTLDSNVLFFTWQQAQLLLLDLDPETVTIPASTFELRATGEGFDVSTKIWFDGVEVPTSYISSGEVSAVIDAAATYTSPAHVPVYVRRGNTVSATLYVDFVYEPLTVFAFDPSVLNVSMGPTTITFTGTGFTPDTQVLWNDLQPYPTVFLDNTTITSMMDPSSYGAVSVPIKVVRGATVVNMSVTIQP